MTHTLPLHLGQNRLGRSDDGDTDVVIPHNATVSSQHCIIDIKAQKPSVHPSSLINPFFTPLHTLLDLDDVFITDLNSSNRTHVASFTFFPTLTSCKPPPVRLDPHRSRLLRHGQHVYLGSQVARFELWKYEQGVRLAKRQRSRRSSVDSRASTQVVQAVGPGETQMMQVEGDEEPGAEGPEPGAVMAPPRDLPAVDEAAERETAGLSKGAAGVTAEDGGFGYDEGLDEDSGQFQTLQQSEDFDVDVETMDTGADGQKLEVIVEGAAQQETVSADRADSAGHPPETAVSADESGAAGGMSAGSEVVLSAGGADSDPLDLQLPGHSSGEDNGNGRGGDDSPPPTPSPTIPSSEQEPVALFSPNATLPLPGLDELGKSASSPLSPAMSSAGQQQEGRKLSARSRRQSPSLAAPRPSSSYAQARIEDEEELRVQAEKEETERFEREQELRRNEQRQKEEEEERRVAEELHQKRERLERERAERAEAEWVERLKAEAKEREEALQRRRERELEEQREEEMDRQRELREQQEREERAKATRQEEERRQREERERLQKEREEADRVAAQQREAAAAEAAKASRERERSASATAAQMEWRPKPKKKPSNAATPPALDEDEPTASSRTPSKRTPRKQANSGADKPNKKRAGKSRKVEVAEEREDEQPPVELEQDPLLSDAEASAPVAAAQTRKASTSGLATRTRSAQPAVVVELEDADDGDETQPVKLARSTEALSVGKRGNKRRRRPSGEKITTPDSDDRQRAGAVGEEKLVDSGDSTAMNGPTKKQESAAQAEEAVTTAEVGTEPLLLSANDDGAAAVCRSVKTQEAMEVLEDLVPTIEAAKALTSPVHAAQPAPIEEAVVSVPSVSKEHAGSRSRKRKLPEQKEAPPEPPPAWSLQAEPSQLPAATLRTAARHWQLHSAHLHLLCALSALLCAAVGKRARARSLQSQAPSPASAASSRSHSTAHPTARCNSGLKKAPQLTSPTSFSSSSTPTSSSPTLPLAHSTRHTTATSPTLLFTGIEPDVFVAAIHQLGGSMTNSPSLASHLISDKVRRTGKFLAAYPRVPYIVGQSFLDASARMGRWADAQLHALVDEEAEERWGFRLKTRVIGVQCFEGWKVYATPHVKPEREAMRGMVEAAGGRLMEEQPAMAEVRVLVVGCEEDEEECLELSKRGYTVYDKEAVLCAVLRQKLEPHEFVLYQADGGGARGQGRSKKK